MGSSSRKKGNQQGVPQKAAAPTGKISNGMGGTNAYYEPGQALPTEGGWVRPDAIPGQPQGIGLNYAMPGSGGSGNRSQLAQVMSQRNLPGRWVDRLGLDPNRITHGSSSSWRGGGDRGGEHASGGRGFW